MYLRFTDIKKIALSALAFLAIPCAAQVDVNLFVSGTAEGVTYYLPDTRLDVTVEAQCITRTPGEFSRYADRFLRISDAVTTKSSEWELTGVRLNMAGVPNKNKAFTVKLNNNAASDIRLNENGIIAAINCDVEQQQPTAEKNPVRKRVDPRIYMTEEILQATSTAKMAELVAKEIYAIRESKLAITRGHSDNMPKDGVSMQLILDELNLQEQTLTELFTGRIDTVAYTGTIKLTPTLVSDTARAVLFRFSRKKGILEPDNLAGAPVYYDFKNMNPPIEQPEEDKKKKKEKKEIKREGICYNIPGHAQIKIYTAGETLFEEEVPVAQFGTVEVLAKNLFERNSNTKVVFDTATGGIKSIDK